MIEQGSDEWKALRCGKVTASRVADLLRKGRAGAPSASRERYLGELVAERLTGVVQPGFKSSDMEWGNATEADACNAYAFYNDAPLEAVAFVDHPSIAMTGCSPDRLVGSAGLLEIKCPATHSHIATLRGAPIDPDYLTQMQWQMACTDRAWCDFVSFDPRMPEEMRLHMRRVKRDEQRIAELTTAVREFLSEIDATVAELTKLYRQEAA